MRNTNGKWLEELVKKFEELGLPPGFSIKSNVRSYRASGKQNNEFDLVIEGTVGTLSQKILIECRDRPSEGKQNANWLAEIEGKKRRHGFNMAVAVSTTGFTEDAIEASKIHHDVTLRKIERVSDFTRLFSKQTVVIQERYIDTDKLNFTFSEGEKRPAPFAGADGGLTIFSGET